MAKTSSTQRDEDFKATADSIASTAERVAAIETEKQSLSPDDPRAKMLAIEVEALVDEMDRESAIQRALTEDDLDGKGRLEH
jgi:hypothetical protein